jgi:hypothetical protein
MALPVNTMDGFGLLRAPPFPKRRIFVSYHHGPDQGYYEGFVRAFTQAYDVLADASLERAFNSDDTDYVRWQIRQNHITGSSCTVVLCGAETHERKYVDWEIKATLDMKHGLVGVWLPTLPKWPNGGTRKPDRLQDNLDTGYAQWRQWELATADVMKTAIELAIAAPSTLIRNSRPLRVRNG